MSTQQNPMFDRTSFRGSIRFAVTIVSVLIVFVGSLIPGPSGVDAMEDSATPSLENRPAENRDVTPSPHEIATAICRRDERRPADVSEVSCKMMWNGYIPPLPQHVVENERLRSVDSDRFETIDDRDFQWIGYATPSENKENIEVAENTEATENTTAKEHTSNTEDQNLPGNRTAGGENPTAEPPLVSVENIQNSEDDKKNQESRFLWTFRLVERHHPSWRGRQIPIQVPIGWRIPVPVLEWGPTTYSSDPASGNVTVATTASGEKIHRVNRIPGSVQIRLPVQPKSVSILDDTWRQRTFDIASRKLTPEEQQLLKRILYSYNELHPIRSVQWETSVPIPSGVSFATESTRIVEEAKLVHPAANTAIAEPRPLFDADEFWNAVFLAGGTNQAAIPTLREQLATIQSGLPAFMLNPSPQDADLLLAHLYQQCFVNGYERNATGLHHPLERQTFNCVSGSLLYYGMARQLGWPVRILVSTGHMRCVVRTTSGDRIIETTNASSGIRHERKKPIETMRVATPDGVVPIPNQMDEREVESLAVLESVLFHNRAILFSESGESEYALSCSAAAVWLDPESKAARSNFIAMLNNIAIQDAQNGEITQAEQWMRTACELAPDHLILAENYRKLKRQIATNQTNQLTPPK